MENTAKVMEKIRETLNTHPAAIEMMDKLQAEAIEKNWTAEQWEEMKVRIMTTLFYKMALDDPEIKKGLAEDLYTEFNKA